MATAKEMFINLVGTAKDTYEMLKSKGVVLADDETAHRRIDICCACPHFVSDSIMPRCSLCGCGMKIKVRLAAASCPIKKWNKI